MRSCYFSTVNPDNATIIYISIQIKRLNIIKIRDFESLAEINCRVIPLHNRRLKRQVGIVIAVAITDTRLTGLP